MTYGPGASDLVCPGGGRNLGWWKKVLEKFSREYSAGWKELVKEDLGHQ